MADKITIPNISAPFLMQNGQVNPVWFHFLINLLRGVESGDDADLVALTLLVRSIQAQSGAEVSIIQPNKQIYTGDVPAHGLQYDEALHALVTTTLAGFMSASDKSKLDGIAAGAAVASVGATAPITSTGGTTPTIAINPATTVAPGSLSAADKTKLDSISNGAAVSAVNGTAPIVSSGGTTPAISITAATGAAAGSMSAADKAKLDSLVYTPASWVPTLSFDTPGNLAITYSARVGNSMQIGNRVFIDFAIATSSFTHTTASGFMRISGFPIPANATFPEFSGVLSWGGIQIVGFMTITADILVANTSIIRLVASGNNVARAQLSTGNAASGSSVVLVGQLSYTP